MFTASKKITEVGLREITYTASSGAAAQTEPPKVYKTGWGSLSLSIYAEVNKE